MFLYFSPTCYWPWVSLLSKSWKYFTCHLRLPLGKGILDCYPRTMRNIFFPINRWLVEWLHKNLTNISPISFQMTPWNILFAYGIWQLWLSRNKRIFNPPSGTLNQLMHKTLHLAAEFYQLAYNRKTKGTKVTKIISWRPPQPSFVTLNMDGSIYQMWVPVSSTGKVSNGCIRDLWFNPHLHQKLIDVLVWW